MLSPFASHTPVRVSALQELSASDATLGSVVPIAASVVSGLVSVADEQARFISRNRGAIAGHAAERLAGQAPEQAPELPNEIWGEIARFSPREDILNLRAVSTALTLQADTALTTLTLFGGTALRKLADSHGFEHIQMLRLHRIDGESFHYFAMRLADHPRLALTVHVISSDGNLAPGLQALQITLLAGLLLNSVYLSPTVIDALALCPFPIQLIGYFSRHELAAASRIPTLTKLSSNSLRFDDDLANLFVSHRALHNVAILGNPALSSTGLQSLAAIRTLRTLFIYDADFIAGSIDPDAATALATNPMLESLCIQTQTTSLSYDTFAALCGSTTLKTLAIAVCPGLHQIADMTSLERLLIDGHTHGSSALDLSAVRGIVALPNLRALDIDFVQFEEDAFALLLSACRAKALRLESMRLHPPEIAALLTNRNLQALELDDIALSPEHIAALCQHTTLVRFAIDSERCSLRN